MCSKAVNCEYKRKGAVLLVELGKKTWLRIFLVATGCIVVYWLLHATASVNSFFRSISAMFSPFVVGAAIAFVINVPMRAIERLLKNVPHPGLRRAISIVLTLILLMLVVAMVFWLLIPQLISTFETLIPQIYNFFIEIGNYVEKFLQEHPELADWVVKNTDLEKINWASLVQNVLSMIGKSVSSIASQAISAIGSVTSALMNFFISVVFAVYCLFQKETLARQGRKLLYAFLPERYADGSVRILRLTNSTFSNFLSGQCVEVCILGSMFAISMAIFKMPYVPLVSVLVAVTAFIPVVGAWIGCAMGAFLILVDDLNLAVWFVIMFVILQQIENNMIYPRVVGTSIGLSGMWVLLAVAVGGKLMGVAGMFLMIPAASVMYTILSEYTRLRLSKRNVDPDKLVPQQPSVTTVREKHAEKKKAKTAKKANHSK